MTPNPIDDDGYQRWCDEWAEARELLHDEHDHDEHDHVASGEVEAP